jgi:hypothetical protein
MMPPPLWIYSVVTLENAHLRIKSVGAIQLDHLANVAQIVKREFVEELSEANDAQLLMPSRALGCV